MRVALYVRVSTRDKQDPRNQIDQLREFAASQGWTITGEYVDRVTGKHSDREQFQRLFAHASQRRFDLVLFWSLDRFSREGVRETLNHLERLSAYGVGYRSLTESYLDSLGMFRDVVLSLLATIAKQERIPLSERTKAGLERARKAGRVGGRPKLITSHKRILQLDEQGCTQREIAEELGISAASVCRVLAQHRAHALAVEQPVII